MTISILHANFNTLYFSFSYATPSHKMYWPGLLLQPLTQLPKSCLLAAARSLCLAQPRLACLKLCCQRSSVLSSQLTLQAGHLHTKPEWKE